MVRFVAVASIALMLSACATATEEASQDINIKLVGTGEALCDMTTDKLRYRAYAPGTMRIQKSNDTMTVRCKAPGNREQVVLLEPTVSAMAATNVANGFVPGATWDYFSGAMYKYPDEVIMDFSSMPPRSYELPDYQKVLMENPTMISMEEFRPGKSALQSDIGNPTALMEKREDVPFVSVANSTSGSDGLKTDASMATAVPAPAGTSSSGMIGASNARAMNADSLTRMMNPQVFGQ